MKGQDFNRANDAKIVDIISDFPGIRCNDLSEKLGIPCNTITRKVKRLTDESRVFRQKQNNDCGYIYNLYTAHYARKHNVSRIYKGVDAEKSTLELQYLFHSLIRGSAL